MRILSSIVIFVAMYILLTVYNVDWFAAVLIVVTVAIVNFIEGTKS